MADAVRNAVFQVLGVTAPQQHIQVVVGFDNHRTGLGGPLQGFVRGVAHIRHQHKEFFPAADGKADTLGGIVRDHKVLDIKIFRNGIPYAGLQILPAGAHPVPGEGVPQQGFVQGGSGPDGGTDPFAERAQGADVVSVLVRDEDGRYIVEAQMQGFQLFLDAANAHAGVYQNAGMGTQQEGTVAAAAAGETHEAHHGRCSSSQYLPITL